MATNPPNIGQLAPADAQRDAIHVAIAPVIAAERLPHGSAVAWATGQEGTAVINVPWDHPNKLGIVDPFRTGFVNAGERFWLFLMPNTVTSLRHEWTHPAFPGVAQSQVSLEEPTRDEVLAAMRHVARNYIVDDNDYDDERTYLEIKTNWLGDGDIWAFARGFDMHSDPGDFWGPVEAKLGRPVPDKYKERTGFTCSC